MKRLTFMQLSGDTYLSRNTYLTSLSPLPLQVRILPSEKRYVLETVTGQVLDAGLATGLIALRMAAKKKLQLLGVAFMKERRKDATNG